MSSSGSQTPLGGNDVPAPTDIAEMLVSGVGDMEKPAVLKPQSKAYSTETGIDLPRIPRRFVRLASFIGRWVRG